VFDIKGSYVTFAISLIYNVDAYKSFLGKTVRLVAGRKHGSVS